MCSDAGGAAHDAAASALDDAPVGHREEAAEEAAVVARHCEKVQVHATPMGEYEPPSLDYLHRNTSTFTCPDPMAIPGRKVGAVPVGGGRGFGMMVGGIKRVTF